MISAEYLWWSYCCVLLAGHFLSHILSHTHTFKMFFWYCGNFFLIHLYFTIDKHTVWHGGCHMFGQSLCDILPARKRLGRPSTTILVSLYYLHKSWFYSVSDSVMMWRITHQGVSCSLCVGVPKLQKSLTFPCFWAGILITKRFRVGQLKDGRVLAITLLKSTTQVVFIYFIYH